MATRLSAVTLATRRPAPALVDCRPLSEAGPPFVRSPTHAHIPEDPRNRTHAHGRSQQGEFLYCTDCIRQCKRTPVYNKSRPAVTQPPIPIPILSSNERTNPGQRNKATTNKQHLIAVAHKIPNLMTSKTPPFTARVGGAQPPAQILHRSYSALRASYY
ncbi:hypothetical protein DM02DRAFT_113336 [Periconia macrospinosa]|uniref:Uncharacterized protein n=1 Tax=Periconia macrospinosa TaxID=97972 RepID=A0A2V1E6H9_9PLEO|nr:hypothetical protein DM02DRAFT_113336 [Periconia macrospinosa]